MGMEVRSALRFFNTSHLRKSVDQATERAAISMLFVLARSAGQPHKLHNVSSPIHFDEARLEASASNAAAGMGAADDGEGLRAESPLGAARNGGHEVTFCVQEP